MAELQGMSGKKRLAIFLSVLWLLISSGIGFASDEALAWTLVAGAFPLVLIWGIWWVVQGFSDPNKKQSPLAQAKPVVPEGPYFVRLWRGDVRLAMTFWFWGFLVLLLVRLADAWAEVNLLLVLEYLGWYYAFMAASLAYAVFIWIAIWRSAEKSTARWRQSPTTASRVGPGLAKASVVLGAIGTVVMYGGRVLLSLI